MEEYLSLPLPLLSLDSDAKSVASSAPSVPSSTGPLTTPTFRDDAQLRISWQAANLLHRIDTNALVHKVPKLAGNFSEIEKVPIIKSYINLLLLLQERDTGKQRITRIPYYQEDATFLIDQVEPLIRVSKKFSFRTPYIYGYGVSRDPNNELGVDFLLLDFIEGRQMPMWTENFPSRDQKSQVLDQMASIYLEMFTKPVTYADRLVCPNANNKARMQDDFDNFDIPPTTSAGAYLHCLADEAITGKIQRLLAPDAEEQAESLGLSMQQRLADLLTLCLMRSLVTDQIVGRYNDSPCYITHPDLHNRNIIIEGDPVPDRPEISTAEFWNLDIDSSQPRTSPPPTHQKAGKLKIAGLVDWDAAHPLPLQLAAIYPKFLETLPGAEFPDLPKDYEPPDLEEEKRTFLQMFKKKEKQATSSTVQADLIEHGSWERDFFTVSLRRGEVRAKWFEWWKEKSAQQQSGQSGRVSGLSLGLDDCAKIRLGLSDYLSKEKHRAVVEERAGWDIIARALLEVDRLEFAAMENCWSCGT